MALSLSRYIIFSDLTIDCWLRSDGDLVYRASNTSDSAVIPAEALETIAKGFY